MCSRVDGERVGVVLAAGELCGRPAGVLAVKASRVGFDHRPRASVTVGRWGGSEKFKIIYSFSEMIK
jgi:hypothetical protein